LDFVFVFFVFLFLSLFDIGLLFTFFDTILSTCDFDSSIIEVPFCMACFIVLLSFDLVFPWLFFSF
jgi:hypothetical protein